MRKLLIISVVVLAVACMAQQVGYSVPTTGVGLKVCIGPGIEYNIRNDCHLCWNLHHSAGQIHKLRIHRSSNGTADHESERIPEQFNPHFPGDHRRGTGNVCSRFKGDLRWGFWWNAAAGVSEYRNADIFCQRMYKRGQWLRNDDVNSRLDARG